MWVGGVLYHGTHAGYYGEDTVDVYEGDFYER